jgi:hypothetical protein
MDGPGDIPDPSVKMIFCCLLRQVVFREELDGDGRRQYV